MRVLSPRRRWRGWRALSPARPSPPTRAGRGLRGCTMQPLWISSEWAVGPISVRYSVWTCVYRGTCASHTVACVPLCVCDCVVCACVCVSLSGGGGRAPLPVFIRRDSKQLTINQKSLCRGAVWRFARAPRRPRARRPACVARTSAAARASRSRGGGSTTDAFPMKTLKRQPRPSVPPGVRPWCSARAPLAPP